MSHFHSIDRSSLSQYDLTGVELVTVKSPSLRGRADVSVYLPDCVKNASEVSDLPVVILLHGVTGSHWGWAASGGAHHVLEKLISENGLSPMLLAMPSDGLRGCGSGYLNIEGEADYENWIIDDLPLLLGELFPQVTASSPLFIAGLSMGGYGALRLGAKHPGRFHAIAGHSSITTYQGLAPYVEEDLASFGNISSQEGDVIAWMHKHQATLPPIRFDCGTEDDLIEANRTLHRQLTEMNIPHEYAEHPGAHSWEYWNKHLAETLQFFSQQLL